MKIKDFKAGEFKSQDSYKSFTPSKINHDWSIDDDKISYLLSKADRLIGELNVYTHLMPNVNNFIRMFMRKEAVSIARLKGSHATLEDSLFKHEKIDPKKKLDWYDVYYYVNAINVAINDLKSNSLSNRLIKHAHTVVLNSIRGENIQMGEYRDSDAWVNGNNLNDAQFIPPQPSEINDLMEDLQAFIQNQNSFIPPLIKIAIIHYQFLTIHPFRDGNNRMALLLITLFLINERILLKPSLCLSDYFEKHRTFYYDNLMAVRTNNNMTKWIQFFLESVIQTVEYNISVLKKIIDLRKAKRDKIVSMDAKNKKFQELLHLLFWQPIIDTNDVINEMNVSKVTALRLIYDFIEMGILKEKTGFKRNRIFVFEQYIQLFR
jgi:Fic family protein